MREYFYTVMLLLLSLGAILYLGSCSALGGAAGSMAGGMLRGNPDVNQEVSTEAEVPQWLLLDQAKQWSHIIEMQGARHESEPKAETPDKSKTKAESRTRSESEPEPEPEFDEDSFIK